jgi:hypothetical protein
MKSFTKFSVAAALVLVSGIIAGEFISGKSVATRVSDSALPAKDAETTAETPIVEAYAIHIDVPEITIVGTVRHHTARQAVSFERSAAQLMAAPMLCGNVTQSSGSGEIAGTSGAGSYRDCVIGL